ncbi:MAG: hypothetical protein HQ481_05650 [Alphaproteobacteria bacterium]|nr:hypothetical protein [Alphaproteobacteria bacterium]
MSFARDRLGPWLDAGVLQRTPQMHRQFDLNRDPLIARQIADLDKTEAERREGSGAAPQKARDKPAPALKPPLDLRGYADRDGWLSAQRDAAFARMTSEDTGRGPDREHDRQPVRTSPGLSL